MRNIELVIPKLEEYSYEEKLKLDLREYIKSGRAAKQQIKKEKFENAKELCDFIQRAHDDYLAHKHDVEDDIRHIVEVNRKALAGMMDVLAEKRIEHFLKHS